MSYCRASPCPDPNAGGWNESHSRAEVPWISQQFGPNSLPGAAKWRLRRLPRNGSLGYAIRRSCLHTRRSRLRVNDGALIESYRIVAFRAANNPAERSPRDSRSQSRCAGSRDQRPPIGRDSNGSTSRTGKSSQRLPLSCSTSPRGGRDARIGSRPGWIASRQGKGYYDRFFAQLPQPLSGRCVLPWSARMKSSSPFQSTNSMSRSISSLRGWQPLSEQRSQRIRSMPRQNRRSPNPAHKTFPSNEQAVDSNPKICDVQPLNVVSEPQNPVPISATTSFQSFDSPIARLTVTPVSNPRMNEPTKVDRQRSEWKSVPFRRTKQAVNGESSRSANCCAESEREPRASLSLVFRDFDLRSLRRSVRSALWHPGAPEQ